MDWYILTPFLFVRKLADIQNGRQIALLFSDNLAHVGANRESTILIETIASQNNGTVSHGFGYARSYSEWLSHKDGQ